MKLRFGVAGSGYWAREVHVRGLQACPGVELVGVWGRDADAARRVAEAAGIRAFPTHEAMLAAVDAVSIAVAPTAQPALALAAARAGKHLLLEKPIALSVAEAEAIVDAVSQQRLAAIVFFLRRFVPAIEAAIIGARGRRWRSASVRVHAAVLSTASPYADSRWRQQDGAELWDIGPHVLSILLPVLGPVARIEAWWQPEGVTRVRTLHREGATADVSLTLRADPSAAGVEYRFDGDDGSLTLPEPAIARPQALADAGGDLARLVAEGRTGHRCDAALGLQVVRVLDAAQRSIASGGAVDVT